MLPGGTCRSIRTQCRAPESSRRVTTNAHSVPDLLADKLDFFLFCARPEKPPAAAAPPAPLDEQRIFDNSMHRISPEVPTYAQSSGLSWPSIYAEYLAMRVRAFSSGPALAPSELLENLAIDPADVSDKARARLVELVELLVAQEPAESRALTRRIAQLDTDVVFHEWYTDRDAFTAWIRRLTEADGRRRSRQLATFETNGYRALVDAARREDAGEEAISLAETVDARLGPTAGHLSAHLRGEAGLATDVVAALQSLESVDPEGYVRDVLPPRDTLPRSVLLRVVQEMARQGAGADRDLITRFVVALTVASGCEVCDFLRFETDLTLRPVAISHPKSPIAALASNPYLRAQGIAGSAALLSEGVERRWVGTNRLRDDPRQSHAHTESWTRATGEDIHDYWVFPVFRERNHYGAFRVFNRLTSRWGNGIPWPEAILWELREVSEWCGSVLLPRLGDGARVRAVTGTVHSSAVQHLKSKLDLEWVDEDFLVTLVTHVTTVVHRVVESLSLGCSIGVFAHPESVVLHSQSYYAAGAVTFSSDPANHLEEAAAAYQKINPASGLFVFDASGAGRGVQRMGSGEIVGRAAVERLTEEHQESLVLMLDRDQDCILVFVGGEVAADYYLSQTTGEWVLRVYEELIEKSVSQRPAAVRTSQVRDVVRRALELSYSRVGAMLILGDGVPEQAYFEQATGLEGVNLRSLTTSEFADMAGLDGAVHIEPSRGVTAVGAIVRTKDGSAATHRHGMEGSRHGSAAAFSAVAPDHMVVVVSENRALSVLVDGRPVHERV